MIALPSAQTPVPQQGGPQAAQAQPGTLPQTGAAAPSEDQAQLLMLLQMLQQSNQIGDAGSMAIQGGDGGSLPSIPGGLPGQASQGDPGMSAVGIPGNNTGALMNMLHQMGM